MNQRELQDRCEAYQVDKIMQIQAWGEQAHEGSFVLLGDSLINRFDEHLLDINKEVINCGIDGATSQTLYLVLDSVIRMKPDKIIFLIGTNDLDDAHEFDCLDITFALYNMISSISRQLPAVKIGIMTPLPIDESRQKTRARNNRTLKMLGNEMMALKDELDHVEVLDLFALFSDAQGSLIDEMTTDGLHLNARGYERLANRLNEWLVSF